jgi:hypothetical protein
MRKSKISTYFLKSGPTVFCQDFDFGKEKKIRHLVKLPIFAKIERMPFRFNPSGVTPAAAGDLPAPVPEGGGDAQPNEADRATGPAADTTGEKYSMRNTPQPRHRPISLLMNCL